ncbi:hypothetical protein PVA19_10300 [Agrobacterium sp. CNPSo 3708]|uniref:hypothetical protein n=1 Tax=Agrobacterium sp. CNPSo 3708 TaxID=3028150 RepID=UPI0023646D89|nr:hypothetical protein [Agrobacterium sp. CNPSo 3708]MDD1498800.1 hypothetical protein [Agrobacterium sp. CNPSo 3708]
MTQLSCQGAAINAARPRSSANTSTSPRNENCGSSQNALLRQVLDEIERINLRDDLHARTLVAAAIASIGAIDDLNVLGAGVPTLRELENSAPDPAKVTLRDGLTTAGRSSPDNFPPIHLTASRP